MAQIANSISKPLSKQKPNPKPKRKGVKSIDIERANNGFLTRTRYETEGEMYDEGDKHVHQSQDAMGQFITQMFSGTPDDAKTRRTQAAKQAVGAKSK
jgi:hypothetical protein